MHGHAYNTISGQTINNTQLSIGYLDIQTESDGYFWGLFGAGTYDLNMNAEGYHAATFENIRVLEGELITKHFGLLPELSIDDAIKVIQLISGMEPAPSISIVFDFNKDGKIELADCMYILQAVADLR